MFLLKFKMQMIIFLLLCIVTSCVTLVTYVGQKHSHTPTNKIEVVQAAEKHSSKYPLLP